jgi:hypothetical protein
VISQALAKELGVALNEATLLGAEVDASTRRAAATFRVLTLPPEGPHPEDPRVQFVFQPVGRVFASLRAGSWNDTSAALIPVTLDRLLEVVQTFGGLPVYGWEFFDTPDPRLGNAADRASLDWRSSPNGTSRSISLFQEGHKRHLDLIIWFDSFELFDAHGAPITVEAFIEGSKRWWDGLYAGDPRAVGSGIQPLE